MNRTHSRTKHGIWVFGYLGILFWYSVDIMDKDDSYPLYILKRSNS